MKERQVFDCELLTDETASIDGKKVTILKEGKVTIVVTSGDLEKSINFDAFSKEKYAYNKYANSVGSEFFIGVVDNSSTGTYLTSDGWLFGEDYTVYSNKAINNSDMAIKVNISKVQVFILLQWMMIKEKF